MRAKGKTQRNRRPRNLTKAGVKALTAAGTLAAGTSAYAEAIRFDNPGNQWDWNLGPFHGSTSDQFLDVTLDAASQGDTYLGYTNFKQAVYYGSPQNPTSTVLYTYAEVLGVPRGNYGYALGIDGGTVIDGGSDFFGGLAWIKNLYYGNEYTYIPEGVQTYLGVRIKVNYQLHYGWIGVVRDDFALEAFAWGYESEPGVGIPAGAPEPSTLALLALGFCAAVRRRG